MKFAARAALVLVAMLPLACSAAPESEFKSGQHYKSVRVEQKPADPAKIEVAEVFWYGCGHCFSFEHAVAKWAAGKPGDVNFIRIPSSLGRPIGMTHSKAYYTAELLGITDKIHLPLFEAIHKDGRMMGTQEELRELFVKAAGIKPEDFDGAFAGFAVDSRVRIAETQLRDMGIASTPTMVVDGKWYTNGSMAGSHDKLIQVVNHLVEKARAERKK